jgi:hypothetical protein
MTSGLSPLSWQAVALNASAMAQANVLESVSVTADAVLPMSAIRAETALWRELSESTFLTVGPIRRGPLQKKVRLASGGAVTYGRSYLFPVRWEPTGALACCYPALEATLAVTTIDDTSSLLSLFGSYVPPARRLGAAADAAGMHRVAQLTAASVVDRLARAIAQSRTRVSSEEDAT